MINLDLTFNLSDLSLMTGSNHIYPGHITGVITSSYYFLIFLILNINFLLFFIYIQLN